MLIDDFTFLNDYGFLFSYEMKHHEQPSVVFNKGLIEIRIGYSYVKNQMYLLRYDPPLEYNPTLKAGLLNCIDLLEKTVLIGSSYKTQLNQVKEIMLKYLHTEFQL